MRFFLFSVVCLLVKLYDDYNELTYCLIYYFVGMTFDNLDKLNIYYNYLIFVYKADF